MFTNAPRMFITLTYLFCVKIYVTSLMQQEFDHFICTPYDIFIDSYIMVFCAYPCILWPIFIVSMNTSHHNKTETHACADHSNIQTWIKTCMQVHMYRPHKIPSLIWIQSLNTFTQYVDVLATKFSLFQWHAVQDYSE